MKYAIELSTAQSARVLEEACRSRQGARVQPKSWQGRALSAELTACREDCLELEAVVAGEAAAGLDLAVLLNTYCTVELELAGGQYFFESHLRAARWREQHLHICLAKPDTVLVQQRRRSRRAAIASSSVVQFSRQDGDQLLSCQGCMYNLSHEGLACQLPRDKSVPVVVGDSWFVCFEVPEQSQWYKLGACVCRRVPSSAAGFVIVGMEFEHSPANDDQLARLAVFLEERRRAGTSPARPAAAAAQPRN